MAGVPILPSQLRGPYWKGPRLSGWHGRKGRMVGKGCDSSSGQPWFSHALATGVRCLRRFADCQKGSPPRRLLGDAHSSYRSPVGGDLTPVGGSPNLVDTPHVVTWVIQSHGMDLGVITIME